jgi:uncharacterized membrane protein
MIERRHRGGLLAAGILAGAGLGGFLDGIVLHQLLQWHHMLSSRVPAADLAALKFNMMWDGLFHLLAWLMTVVGMGLLWRAGHRTDVPWSTRTFAGALCGGWGLFNLVEGLIDHQLLGVHHVHPGRGELAWDLGYLASGVLLGAIGWAAIRGGQTDRAPRGLPEGPGRTASVPV